MGSSRREYWDGLPCPSPGDHPDPGIEPMSLMSPALAGRFFTSGRRLVKQKTKNRTTIWSSNPTPVPISRGSHNSKRYMCPNIHYSTIYNSQDMEATKCPSTKEGIKKTQNIYTMKYYSAIKRNEVVPFAETWTDLEAVIQSKLSQKEKNNYHLLMHTCGI